MATLYPMVRRANNYLIKDEQVTLVDSVKHDFASTTLANIKALVDPTKIVNLIINHTSLTMRAA